MAEKALKEGVRRFPLILKLKLLLVECSIDEDNKIRFRNRKWVLRLESLRTGIIHQTYISIFTGHSGKEVMYKLVANQYFWPGMSEDIK